MGVVCVGLLQSYYQKSDNERANWEAKGLGLLEQAWMGRWQRRLTRLSTGSPLESLILDEAIVTGAQGEYNSAIETDLSCLKGG